MLPPFENEQDAADFWDTHSPLDYPEELEVVDVTVDRSVRRQRVTVDRDAVSRPGAPASDSCRSG